MMLNADCLIHLNNGFLKLKYISCALQINGCDFFFFFFFFFFLGLD